MQCMIGDIGHFGKSAIIPSSGIGGPGPISLAAPSPGGIFAGASVKGLLTCPSPLPLARPRWWTRAGCGQASTRPFAWALACQPQGQPVRGDLPGRPKPAALIVSR
jgi:hypothetical protein